jgi:UDP-glucose 4-epimerase
VKKNVLVVGGAGYIGSHMVLALQEAGFSVTVFDNLSRGFADAVPADILFEGDLLSKDDLKKCFAAKKFDAVMHFAALAYVGESVFEPERYYENNVIGTLNLLSEMRRLKVGKLIFSSSCATYGEPKYLPITEAHPQFPINPYGSTKYIIEQVLTHYALAYGLRSISLRYFNAAGCDAQGRVGERHDPETHLIPLVLAEAQRTQLGGQPESTGLKVFGVDFDTPDGSCIRDYIHVSDLCTAHLQAMGRMFSHIGQGAEFFNLANGDGFSVLEVISVCRAVTGEPILYHHFPRRPGDPAKLVGDARLAETELGWQPNYTSLEEIVQTAWNCLLKESKSGK